jgi:hypothetical protein
VPLLRRAERGDSSMSSYGMVMDHSKAPVLEALADYREVGRYGFSPPGHRQGRGTDPRVLNTLGDQPFVMTSWQAAASTIAGRATAT